METPSIFDRGIEKVKNVVSEASVEQRGFIKAIARTCYDGWLQGWHEGNGGNLSYRMTPEETSACRSYFSETVGEWVGLGVRAVGLQNECFVVTAQGAQFRNVMLDPASCLGIVEVNPTGDAYRNVWGFKGGGQPTSEFTSHFINHSVRKAVTNGSCRIVYHAHPTSAIALGSVLQNDSKKLSRALWQSLAESILLLPEGIGATKRLAPGSIELAGATSELMEKTSSVLWPHHGVICSANDLDSALGLMHTIEKASAIYLQAAAAKRGASGPDMPTDADLRSVAEAFGVTLEEKYLG
ncbi:MAG: rhamnulose-1-phosphate aldolase [Eggerthellaceae bacterium]|jgi:rhamnulose-1-phosphate aldolase|nr:rhamnulose-1-phosphate aldolase [Eggerthellaceae bacterium]MDR2715703.1 rhamnulose-1-phosphate aldolase [Coriobacteriaceae bacterium]